LPHRPEGICGSNDIIDIFAANGPFNLRQQLAKHVELVRCKTDAVVGAWNLLDDHVNLEFSFVRVQ